MISAKEKAKELFDKMKGFRVKHSHSKKCAIIAVDEIYALDDLKVGRFEGARDIEMYYSYWEDVKTELEKL